MRRCLLGRRSERFSLGGDAFSKPPTECRVKRRFLGHLTTHCATRRNSLASKIVRLLSESPYTEQPNPGARSCTGTQSRNQRRVGGSLEVFGRHAGGITSQPQPGYPIMVTENISNLGKLRQSPMRKAWHTHGNTLPGGSVNTSSALFTIPCDCTYLLVLLVTQLRSQSTYTLLCPLLIFFIQPLFSQC